MTVDPVATIVITTKNRKDDLARALRSAIAISTPVEILVIDDGSEDGTADMVREAFPTVRLERFNESAGLIVRRNQGARLAQGPIIFSIDDDAEFSSPRVVGQILEAFVDPTIAAVAIPFTEPNKTGDTMFQSPPDGTAGWRTNVFIGTAHALRRETFLKLGGYEDFLVHQGEETDYCLRLLDAGYGIALGVSDPIYHYESPKRDTRRMDYYGARNNVLFAWQNIPFPAVLGALPAITLKTVVYTLEWPRLRVRAGAVLDAFRLFRKTPRRPVSRSTFATFRRLKRQGPERG